MGKPVIIDDGGSIRIKRLLPNGVGAMDGLLDVDYMRADPRSHAKIDGPFVRVTVSYMDKDGVGVGFVNLELSPNDEITIDTDNGQQVVFSLDGVRNGSIDLIGVNGAIPIVEAKQFKGRRRYVVTNAGSISKVRPTKGAIQFLMDAVIQQSIYTSVAFLTPNQVGDEGA